MPTAIAAKTMSVTRPPPQRSETQPASEARHRAHQRAEEGEGERVLFGKQRLGEKREAGRKADERAERARIEPAHDPGVGALEDNRLLGEGGLGVRQIVHAEPGGEGRDDDERHEDVAGVLEPKRAALAERLGIAAQPAEDRRRDRDRHDELDDADAEIAEAGIEGERVSLSALG